ncbi:MAG TPA: MBL fold metallo-hydrolase [Spirochaetota bacterium]|nr:MBL fold metallo-hydrolase [Spirochaetota bacterium]
MKITSDIFEVGGPSLSHPSDAAVYMILSEGETALIDAGTGGATQRILKNMKMCGAQPEKTRQLFLTHCHYDHTGGAAEIREHTGCRIIAHELDARYLEAGDSEVTAASWYGSFMQPLSVDVKVSEKKRTFTVGGLQIDFVHTPGHSPGSSALTVRSDGLLVLFGQDVHGPLNDSLLSNRNDYIRSLEFLISLEADILCEGHFGVYHGKDEVRDFIESFL